MAYQPMLELLAYLRANGFKTYIVSGGGVDFMRPWSEKVYGIPPEQVVGSSIKTKFEFRDGKPVLIYVPELDFIDNNTNWDFTLQENTSLQNPSNAVSGQTGSILIRQNPITPYVLTFDTAWKFPYFTPPSITPVAASVDMLQFVVVDAGYIVVTKYLTELG
jgi:hypothetical protein